MSTLFFINFANNRVAYGIRQSLNSIVSIHFIKFQQRITKTEMYTVTDRNIHIY